MQNCSTGNKDEKLPQSSLRDASPLWDGAFGIAESFAAKVQSCLPESYPFRLLPLVAATFPKGTAFGGGGKVSGIAQRRPLEGRLPPLRGKMSRSDKRGNLANAVSLRGWLQRQR